MTCILDAAEAFKEATDDCRRKIQVLAGRTLANLFFENSTRTRNSFSLAARRLGADTVEFSSSGSSVGEGRDVHRHGQEHRGDGRRCRRRPASHARHAAPAWPRTSTARSSTPATGRTSIRRRACSTSSRSASAAAALAGLTVALVGDIAHSRTARSNIWGLKKLGAHVIVCGPATLVSRRWEEFGVEVAYNLDEILPRCDVLNLLRIQFERQHTRPFPSVREYALLYAMNRERLARAKDDILILAPGPINRGVEITPDVADGPHCVILEQVTNGLAVRMAVLWLTDGE